MEAGEGSASRLELDKGSTDRFVDDQQTADSAEAGADRVIDFRKAVQEERIGPLWRRSRVQARRIDHPLGRGSWRSLLGGERV